MLLACSACYWPVPGLFRLLLACSLVVPLVTDLFLACSACYWLVPLVPCFSNIDKESYHEKFIAMIKPNLYNINRLPNVRLDRYEDENIQFLRPKNID